MCNQRRVLLLLHLLLTLEHSNKVSNECDFESSDLCGWTSEMSEYFKWRRVTAADVFTSFHTGPRHDHTTMTATGGHYMVMESFGATSTPVALSSPIYGRDVSLMTASCFQFYYFMYGAGVGNLNVYVKPVTKMLMEVLQDKENYLKFTKSGNQNNNWNEAHFSIDNMEDDFQVVFVADGAKNHLSDIAIDDVKIMTGTVGKALDYHNQESTTDSINDDQLSKMFASPTTTTTNTSLAATTTRTTPKPTSTKSSASTTTTTTTTEKSTPPTTTSLKPTTTTKRSTVSSTTKPLVSAQSIFISLIFLFL